MINYDDFSKIEITIGEIIAAEIVPDADRLLKLSVNVGEEGPRQIVSGIRTFFEDPQSLVGKRCAFVTNLEHRTIRGLESEGMILAASTPDGSFALLEPSADIPVGARVS